MQVYAEASGVEAVDYFSGSHMYSILDRYENTITLYCPLPDTSTGKDATSLGFGAFYFDFFNWNLEILVMYLFICINSF